MWAAWGLHIFEALGALKIGKEVTSNSPNDIKKSYVETAKMYKQRWWLPRRDFTIKKAKKLLYFSRFEWEKFAALSLR